MSASTAWLALGYAAFIVYGSLVPLDFQPTPWAAAVEAFRHVPYLQLGLASRADWVANGVLYLPLGALCARLFGASRRGAWLLGATVLASAACAALAVAVEFAQLFFPPRTMSQNDMIAEAIGGLLGALAAALAGPWLGRFGAAWAGRGERLPRHLLQAYALGYVLFCFFPFDLLLTADELRGKLASNAWGWWLARPEGQAGWRIALHWAVEVVLTMPFGPLLARNAPPGRAGLLRAALLGALLGAAIEVAQIFVETSISQGASVLSRALGTALGLWAARRLHRAGVEPWRHALRRITLPVCVVYLPLLTLANGWWSHPWHGPAGVPGAWAELRLLPFYYQYFTSEAIALYSSGSVVVMYLPVAALCWAWRVTPGRAAVLAGALALLMEASKLGLADTHADPTDVLLAAASCALALGAARWLQTRPQAAMPPAAAAHAAAAALAPSQPARARGGALLLWLLPPLALLGALALPAFPLAAAAVIAAAALLTWRHPLALLAIVPAALPLFDLAPWTGRFFVDEFDLLCAACVPIALLRSRGAVPPGRPRWQWRAWMLPFAAFAISLALAALRPLWPWPGLDANSFSSFLSPFNGLRIAKGALWAAAFLLVWRRLAATDPAPARRALSAGFELGLAATIAVVVWERIAFAGLFDLTATFRVSGPFSAMLRGGAYVECFLAVAAAFSAAALLDVRPAGRRAVALVLFCAAAYAVFVTYSRGGYAAFALVGIGAAAVALRRAGRRRRHVAGLAAAVLGAVAVAAAALGSGFARERLAQSGQDLAIRSAHWADALRLRDPAPAAQLFGSGLGRFPDSHFWRSREAVHAAPFDIALDAGNRFLRLGSGATVYVEQAVALPPGAALQLSARLRSAAAAPTLRVMLCRKWGLTSSDCASAVLRGSGAAGQWQRAEAVLRVPNAGAAWYARPPLKLSLLTPEGGLAVDVDDLALLPVPDGATAAANPPAHLLTNGDFTAGMDRWFFSTDTDPPWHIHQLGVALLFDQGWFGLLAAAALAAVALAGGWRALRRGEPGAFGPLAGFAAFLACGALNTLIDAPRFLWLFLVLAGINAAAGRSAGRPAVDEYAQLAGGERGP